MSSTLFPNLSYEKKRRSKAKSKKFQTKKQLTINYLLIFVFVTALLWLLFEYLKIPFSPLIALILVMNFVAIFLMGLDKTYARIQNATRIPELFFYLISALGGSIGILAGAKIFHHKVSKISFLIWPVLILLIQSIVLGYLLVKS